MSIGKFSSDGILNLSTKQDFYEAIRNYSDTADFTPGRHLMLDMVAIRRFFSVAAKLGVLEVSDFCGPLKSHQFDKSVIFFPTTNILLKQDKHTLKAFQQGVVPFVADKARELIESMANEAAMQLNPD